MSEGAARLGDAIEHSSALRGLIAGALIGAAVAVAVVGTGGLAAVAVVGAAVAGGAGIGEVIGSLSFAREYTGNIVSGSPDVFINAQPAARAHVDAITCNEHATPPPVIAQGSSSVFINGAPAARTNDQTSCGARIAAGSSNVFIGGNTITTDEINPEVPAWVHGALLVVGLGSACVLVGPAVAIGATILGAIGADIGHDAGATLFGERSDGQKLLSLSGGVLGGLIGAKGVAAFNQRYTITAQGFGSNFGNVQVRARTQEGVGSRAAVSIPGIDRPLRRTNTLHPPNAAVVARMNSLRICNGTDCSEIAGVLRTTAGKGRILRVTAQRQSDLSLLEYGKIDSGFRYHEVFTDGNYVYDPRLSSFAVPLGDWTRMIKRLNVGAVIK